MDTVGEFSPGGLAPRTRLTGALQLLRIPAEWPSRGIHQEYPILEYYSRGFSVHATTQRGVLMVMCYTGKFFAFRVRDFVRHRAGLQQADFGPRGDDEGRIRQAGQLFGPSGRPQAVAEPCDSGILAWPQ